MRRLWLVLSLAIATPAAAQFTSTQGPDLRDLAYARNIAMGGAYESLGYGAESIGGNPAAMSIYKRYQIEASGAWDIPQGYGFGTLGLADSTNPLAAGVAYTFATFGGSERTWAHVTTLALSYSFGDLIHIGLAGRHHALLGGSNTNSITMNAGVVVRPAEWLSIGLSGHNLIPVYNANVSRYFVASISSQLFGQLSPCFDLRADFNQPTPRFAFEGGLEWLIAQLIPVRAGYQYDAIGGHQYVSGGIGWFSDGSGVDVAYRHEIGGLNGRLISLSLKLQL